VSPTPPAPWDELHRRAHALPPDRLAAFALACAECLVNLEASARQAELRQALARGWAVLAGGADDLAPLREQLEARDDVDDDPVASVYYALGGVQGSADDAWWAAERASDAAYERVPYLDDASTFRSLEVDTASEEVQQELARQRDALAALEADGPLPEVIARLRT
jgi:hypothetical protein